MFDRRFRHRRARLFQQQHGVVDEQAGRLAGGIAPDLRELEASYDGDEWYKERVINGAVRDGAVYMPRMADTLSQEALWAIRTYIEAEAAKQ